MVEDCDDADLVRSIIVGGSKLSPRGAKGLMCSEFGFAKALRLQ